MILKGPPDFIIKAVWILLALLLLLIIYYLVNIGNNYVQDKKRIKISNKKVLGILGIIILVYFIFFMFRKYSILYDTFSALIISVILAYLFNPIVNYLEQKKINRMLGVWIVYLSILGIILILAFLVIPKSGSEIKRLTSNLPNYFKQASKIIDDMYTRYYSTLGGLPPMFQGVESVIMDNIVRIENTIVNGLKSLVGGVINTFSKVVSIILVPILTLYFLVDKDFFKEKIINFIPIKYRKDLMSLSYDIDHSLSKFVRGRALMSLYVGLATTIVLLIMRIDFAIVIGFITGLTDIVPYIGPALGFIPAVFFALISNPIKALWVSLFFVFIQWAENNILAPKIMGESLGLHPLIVLLSIIIGGGIFGVLGMIFAVPFIAIVKIIFTFIKKRIKNPPKDSI